ncbi:MAG: ABC transporter ATP-binding protein [Bryobacteraceae bacterium]
MLLVESLVKEYPSPAGALRVLDGISLRLDPGQAVSIMGPSGCGKSTLLSILGGLEAPSSGSVSIDGSDPYSLGETDLARFRNEKIGFVFQDHCLLPQCTVLENVLIPTLVAADPVDRSARARQLLEQVGLGARLDHLPSQLSGGEKQRAAIARALVLDPALVLCDEPTGNLDRKAAAAVADLLLDLTRQRQTMLVLVTHSEHLAARAPSRYELADGQLETRA